MASADLKALYSQPEIVDFYRSSAGADGLWPEEESLVVTRVPREAVLLDAGCRAGRISFGLWELGYRQVIGIDCSRPLIEAARLLAAKLEYATAFRVGDLARLGFDAGTFDGVFWSGNGIADYPEPADRLAVLAELRRVTRDGGALLLSSPEGDSAEALTAVCALAGWDARETARTAPDATRANRPGAGFPAGTRFWRAQAVNP